MPIINLRDPMVEAALAKLKNSEACRASTSPRAVCDLFENTYKCKIVSMNAVCTEGHLFFPNSRDQTFFILQFSGDNDDTRNRK